LVDVGIFIDAKRSCAKGHGSDIGLAPLIMATRSQKGRNVKTPFLDCELRFMRLVERVS